MKSKKTITIGRLIIKWTGKQKTSARKQNRPEIIRVSANNRVIGG